MIMEDEKEWKRQFQKKVELSIAKKRFDLGFGLFLAFLVMLFVRSNFHGVVAGYDYIVRIAFDYFYMFVAMSLAIFGGYLIGNAMGTMAEMRKNG